jgi:hypothetical protein
LPECLWVTLKAYEGGAFNRRKRQKNFRDLKKKEDCSKNNRVGSGCIIQREALWP